MAHRLNSWQGLWIVLSVLYTVPVVVFTVDSLPNAAYFSRARAYCSHAYALDTIRAVSRYYETTEPNFRFMGARAVRADQYQGLTDQQIVDRLQGIWGDRVTFTQVEARYQRRLDEVRTADIKIIGHGILVWLIPIAVIFVLGLSVGWIIDGFRS